MTKRTAEIIFNRASSEIVLCINEESAVIAQSLSNAIVDALNWGKDAIVISGLPVEFDPVAEDVVHLGVKPEAKVTTTARNVGRAVNAGLSELMVLCLASGCARVTIIDGAASDDPEIELQSEADERAAQNSPIFATSSEVDAVLREQGVFIEVHRVDDGSDPNFTECVGVVRKSSEGGATQ